MSNRILVIAEGERAERNFLSSMGNAFKFEYEFCCLKGNIYLLYKRMKEVDFNADVKSILLEMHPEYREQLSGRFAYTYLLFDMDPHHTNRNDGRTIDEIVKENCQRIGEMVEYFTDETDPTVGKLYINYPMLESYRTCNSTFDESYKDEFVMLEDISSFKQYAGTKKMVRRHLKDYTRDDFMQLANMNVHKLNWICFQQWDVMPYEDYMSSSEQKCILDKQIQSIEYSRQVAVLNTSLFLLLDYYGNRDGFFDSVLMQSPSIAKRNL